MEITAETTISELQAHFGALDGDPTLKITVEDGVFFAELRISDDRAMVTARTLADALGHLGMWVDVLLQDTLMDFTALSASGNPGTLYAFIDDRLADLPTGEVVQCRRRTKVEVRKMADYWAAVRRLLSFGLSVRGSYDLVNGMGRIWAAAKPANLDE